MALISVSFLGPIGVSQAKDVQPPIPPVRALSKADSDRLHAQAARISLSGLIGTSAIRTSLNEAGLKDVILIPRTYENYIHIATLPAAELTKARSEGDYVDPKFQMSMQLRSGTRFLEVRGWAVDDFNGDGKIDFALHWAGEEAGTKKPIHTVLAGLQDLNDAFQPVPAFELKQSPKDSTVLTTAVKERIKGKNDPFLAPRQIRLTDNCEPVTVAPGYAAALCKGKGPKPKVQFTDGSPTLVKFDFPQAADEAVGEAQVMGDDRAVALTYESFECEVVEVYSWKTKKRLHSTGCGNSAYCSVGKFPKPGDYNLVIDCGENAKKKSVRICHSTER